MSQREFEIDIESLQNQIQQQRLENQSDSDNDFSFRTSIFTLGTDTRVQQAQTYQPTLSKIDILVDGANYPYLQLNFQIDRKAVDSGKIVAFRVYRRKLTPEEASVYKTLSYEITESAFQKLTQRAKKVGKFSEEKKAVEKTKKNTIPNSVIKNPFITRTSFSSNPNSKESISYTVSSDTPNLNSYDFTLLGSVVYTSFLKSISTKFVVSRNLNVAELYYRDTSVLLGEAYEYYIESVSSDLGGSTKSNTIALVVELNYNVSPPTTFYLKKIKENEIEASLTFNESDLAENILIYRKSSQELNYSYAAKLNISGLSAKFIDKDIKYGLNYSYRVFSENIFGRISEPIEASIDATISGITAKSQENVLKSAVLSAVQDQNSDSIKLSIFPNDPKIKYYEITRKNLSLKERKFSVPGKDTTNYGGNGWENNKFFVKLKQNLVSVSETDFSTNVSFEQIDFIDDKVQFGHIYQYRAQGFDLFGNSGGCAFKIVRSSNKKNLRTPINLKFEKLRDYPHRLKIAWDDDNIEQNKFISNLSDSSKNNLFYELQRRKIDEDTYQIFPLTKNRYIIDEVPSTDYVSFDGTLLGSSASVQVTAAERPSDFPKFLKPNDVYFYRVASRTDTDNSNFSNEKEYITFTSLESVINPKVLIINSKVDPFFCEISWEYDSNKTYPDNFVIERKVDAVNDIYRIIGKSYINNRFYDYSIKRGYSYIYRITAYGPTGLSSPSVEVKISA